MNFDSIKYELQNILQGKGEVSYGEPIQAIASFLRTGEEQPVFIEYNTKILKLNDSIYYTSWSEYLNNLLLNNYFFPDTAYNLVGFYKSDINVVYALVEQNYYVESSQPTETVFYIKPDIFWK